MSDWADDVYQAAKMSYPRLVPELDAMWHAGDIGLALEMLLDQPGIGV